MASYNPRYDRNVFPSLPHLHREDPVKVVICTDPGCRPRQDCLMPKLCKDNGLCDSNGLKVRGHDAVNQVCPR